MNDEISAKEIEEPQQTCGRVKKFLQTVGCDFHPYQRPGGHQSFIG